MIRLHRMEIPVATSMIRLADRLPQREDPLQTYLLYWIAFNNIYTVLADQLGEAPTLRRDGNKQVKTRPLGNLQMPQVAPVRERKQIEVAFSQFDVSLKKALVNHRNVQFFVERTPKWRNQSISHDALGQQLNGVLNVGYTVDEHHPVWSPIDRQAYQQYINGENDSAVRDQLAEELLWILYTVRNNIVHGGKRADDANDLEVVRNALPLLKMIVAYFVISDRPPRQPRLPY